MLKLRKRSNTDSGGKGKGGLAVIVLLLICLIVAIAELRNRPVAPLQASGRESIKESSETPQVVKESSETPPVAIDDRLFDIEIGTNGRLEKNTADVLVTFDPGDVLKKTEVLESYPFGIADFTGTAKFWVNDDARACSSLNYIHAFDFGDATGAADIKEAFKKWQIGKRCSEGHSDIAYRCMFPTNSHYETIPVRRLSEFMDERGIRRVNMLQIDTQGSDFAVLKDVMEHAPHVHIKTVKLECNYYAESRPLYFASNDCEQILDYVKQKHPNMKARKQLNNCWVMEYNLIIQLNDAEKKQ